jgi:hypothetical protein
LDEPSRTFLYKGKEKKGVLCGRYLHLSYGSNPPPDKSSPRFKQNTPQPSQKGERESTLTQKAIPSTIVEVQFIERLFGQRILSINLTRNL